MIKQIEGQHHIPFYETEVGKKIVKCITTVVPLSKGILCEQLLRLSFDKKGLMCREVVFYMACPLFEGLLNVLTRWPKCAS